MNKLTDLQSVIITGIILILLFMYGGYSLRCGDKKRYHNKKGKEGCSYPGGSCQNNNDCCPGGICNTSLNQCMTCTENGKRCSAYNECCSGYCNENDLCTAWPTTKPGIYTECTEKLNDPCPSDSYSVSYGGTEYCCLSRISDPEMLCGQSGMPSCPSGSGCAVLPDPSGLLINIPSDLNSDYYTSDKSYCQIPKIKH